MKANVPSITGLVLTSNGERLIAKCLNSLAFCDAVLVVDCGSVDATRALAREAGAKVVEHPWPGFAEQFTYAAAQVNTDWFFILDQDECCSEALAAAMRLKIQEAKDLNAFTVARRSWYFDRFMKHSGWLPDHILRVFKTGLVTFSQDAHIHYHPEGKTGHIPQGEIIHYPYINFDHQLSKLNVYASQGAESLRAAGKRGGIARGLLSAAARFLRIYILKAGFLDGKAGFLAAAHGAFYAFSKYIRVLDSSWGKPYDHK
jgi:glycosyltransferase involved in cell wall biosynthesis